MEEVFQRFGHIGEQIFEELDSQTLLKCGFVGRDWKLFLDQGKFQEFRIIKMYTNIDENYLRNRLKKIAVETAKELATTVKNMYQQFPQNQENVNPSLNRKTLLHQAAERGHFLLCELIIDNVDEKNPMGDDYLKTNTPLHLAAENGQFEICQVIIDNVE